MSVHVVTISKPIRRTAFEISRQVRIVRCETCPAFRKEVVDGPEVNRVAAAHRKSDS